MAACRAYHLQDPQPAVLLCTSVAGQSPCQIRLPLGAALTIWPERLLNTVILCCQAVRQGVLQGRRRPSCWSQARPAHSTPAFLCHHLLHRQQQPHQWHSCPHHHRHPPLRGLPRPTSLRPRSYVTADWVRVPCMAACICYALRLPCPAREALLEMFQAADYMQQAKCSHTQVRMWLFISG